MNNEAVDDELVLFTILIAGFFLRFHELGRQSFWFDEAGTWGAVVNTTWLTLWGVILAVSNGLPLHYALTKFAALFFGVSEFGLRAPAAFLGWLAIPVVYRLGRAMFGQAAGILASALIAASPFAVWFARDARPYGLYLLFAALALWGFWRAEHIGRRQDWMLFIASSAVLYISHYISALFVYAQAAYILTQLRRQPLLFRRWFLAQMVAAVPVAGWALAFLAQRQPLTSMAWIPRVSPLTPLQTLWNFVSGDAAQWTLLMAMGVVILVGLLAWGARSYRRSISVQLLLWWLLLPLTTAWIFSLRLPAYVDRFFEPAILAALLLLAVGLVDLPRRVRIVAVPVVLVGMLLGCVRLFTDPIFTKEDWRGAARTIQIEGLPVGYPDVESVLGLAPYVSSPAKIAPAHTESELSARLIEGRFVLVLRSPHDSAHALSKSAPFDPLIEGPDFFLQWRAEHPDVPMKVLRFTGLALVVIGQ